MNETLSQAPIVSIITPFFEADDTVVDAIQSVLEQSIDDGELLLVDDNYRNAKNNKGGLKYRTDDPHINILKTTGYTGAGPSRNVGIEAARGRFIEFLDADDLWHPLKLEIQINAMLSEKNVLSCTAYARVNGSTGKITMVGVPTSITREDLLRTNLIACSSAMFDRSHFGAQRMPALRRRQDFAFWLMLLEDGSGVLGIPTPLLTHRQRPNSLSAQPIQAMRDKWIMYRHHLVLALIRARFYFSHYAIRGLVRCFAPRSARIVGWMHPVVNLPE